MVLNHMQQQLVSSYWQEKEMRDEGVLYPKTLLIGFNVE